MFLDATTFFLLPPLYHVGLLLLAALTFEAIKRRHEYWAFPALMVYGTTWLWYYPDMNVRWNAYNMQFTALEMDIALAQMIGYLVAFRALLPFMTQKIIGREETQSKVPSLPNADTLFLLVLSVWALLLIIGIVTHGRGIFASLFPIEGRSNWSFMFGRGRVGGTFSWLISIAGNSYTVAVIFLGIFIFLPKSPHLQYINVGAYLISLPFFFFTGTRTSFLEVVAPMGLAMLFLGRMPLQTKVVWAGVLFVAFNSALLLMLTYRNIGFSQLFAASDPMVETETGYREHSGANMLEELLHINRFQNTGVYPVQNMGNYMSEVFQVIPRAFWPGKPEIGAEISVLRGFTDGRGNQMGTVAMGKVGQAVVNGGQLLGPLICALLMAAFCGWLGRLWVQGHSYLRCCLYIAGLCFIFNMGRNIGLINMWPMVFGVVIVLGIERLMKSSLPAARLLTGSRPVVQQRVVS